MPPSILLLPGIGDSGPDHWQTLWAQRDTTAVRIQDQDWHRPVCQAWVENLDAVVERVGPNCVLVAHSLGCLQVAHWVQFSRQRIMGALLVAVPDPYASTFPTQALGFAPLALDRFPFPSMIVASSDDPYADLDFSQRCADAWGSQLVGIGAHGHINAASGLGDWPQGLELVSELIEVCADSA